MREKLQRISEFFEEHSQPFRLLMNVTLIFILTTMALDFMATFQSGFMKQMLFIQFNPPIASKEPVFHSIMFIEVMATGFVWSSSVSRFPRLFIKTIFGPEAWMKLKERIWILKED